MNAKERLQGLQDRANRLRIHSIRATTAAGSGHPTSCASAAEIAAALFFDVMRLRPGEPPAPGEDRFVLSKGHAAPLLYAAWAEAGRAAPRREAARNATTDADPATTRCRGRVLLVVFTAPKSGASSPHAGSTLRCRAARLLACYRLGRVRE